MTAWWEIRDADGDYICSRGTKRECIELLKKHVFDPPRFLGWSRGPYSIWRMTSDRRCVYRPTPNACATPKEKT